MLGIVAYTSINDVSVMESSVNVRDPPAAVRDCDGSLLDVFLSTFEIRSLRSLSTVSIRSFSDARNFFVLPEITPAVSPEEISGYSSVASTTVPIGTFVASPAVSSNAVKDSSTVEFPRLICSDL